MPHPWGALGTISIKAGLSLTKQIRLALTWRINMEDRNTPQFTIGELLYALDQLKQEEGILRSNIHGLVENMHEANARGGAEEVQHFMDWIVHDAVGFDRIKGRQRQAQSAIRTLNRLVRAFNQQ
jgi:hypothetical protein